MSNKGKVFEGVVHSDREDREVTRQAIQAIFNALGRERTLIKAPELITDRSDGPVYVIHAEHFRDDSPETDTCSAFIQIARKGSPDAD